MVKNSNLKTEYTLSYVLDKIFKMDLWSSIEVLFEFKLPTLRHQHIRWGSFIKKELSRNEWRKKGSRDRPWWASGLGYCVISLNLLYINTIGAG